MTNDPTNFPGVIRMGIADAIRRIDMRRAESDSTIATVTLVHAAEYLERQLITITEERHAPNHTHEPADAPHHGVRAGA